MIFLIKLLNLSNKLLICFVVVVDFFCGGDFSCQSLIHSLSAISYFTYWLSPLLNDNPPMHILAKDVYFFPPLYN